MRGLAGDAFDHVLRQRPVEQTPLFILMRLAGLARLPERGKALLFRRDDMRLHLKEIFGDKVLNLFIAAHHQPQHRRLDAPYREHPLVARVAPQQRPGAGHIDAVKPVGPCPRQRRDAERNKFAVGAQATNRPLYRLRVEIVNQTALDTLTLLRRELEIVEHLIHQQLTLAIRVTGVNNLAGLAKQTLDHVDLLGDRGARLQLPLLRHDRQIRQAPAGVAAVIDIRLRLLKQVTDAPGHHLAVATLDIAVALAVRLWQHVGNGTAQAGFFGNKQPHCLNNLNHWATCTGSHQLADGAQGDIKLGGGGFHLIFRLR